MLKSFKKNHPMDIKNPKNSIWIIPVISFVLNFLTKIAIIKEPPAWLVLGIYLMGFALIGYLANIYKKEKANEKAIEFFKEMVSIKEISPDGTEKITGRIAGNTADVVKELLTNLQ